MKSPTFNGEQWVELESVETTQAVAARYLLSADPIGVVFAKQQTAGKGRLGRVWLSSEGDSLTFSLILRAYADYPQPHLIGMACSLAAAGVLHCQLRWPNDLTFGEKKLGGILTELLPDNNGRMVPVVGIGINLNQSEFPPEIERIATSLHLARGGNYEPQLIAHRIVERLKMLPEPTDWSELAPIWNVFDNTPGKRYKLLDGQQAVALALGSQGELICSVDGETRTILAAEAIFG